MPSEAERVSASAHVKTGLSAVPFIKSTAIHTATTTKKVEIHSLPAQDYIDEAEQVVKIVQNTNPNDEIAILVRNRRHLEAIIPTLQRSMEEPAFLIRSAK